MLISLLGFLDKQTEPFMKELWSLLLSAQESPLRVPALLLEQKKEEMRKRQEDKSRTDEVALVRARNEETKTRAIDDIRQRERQERDMQRIDGANDGRDSSYRNDRRPPPQRSRDNGWGNKVGNNRSDDRDAEERYHSRREDRPPRRFDQIDRRDRVNHREDRRRRSPTRSRSRSPPRRRRRSPSPVVDKDSRRERDRKPQYSRSASRSRSRSRYHSRSPPRRRRRSPSISRSRSRSPPTNSRSGRGREDGRRERRRPSPTRSRSKSPQGERDERLRSASHDQVDKEDELKARLQARRSNVE